LDIILCEQKLQFLVTHVLLFLRLLRRLRHLNNV